MVKIGQLRRWKSLLQIPVDFAENSSRIFLVHNVNPPNQNGETFIGYIMDGKHHWDDIVWIEEYSEVISDD